MLNGSQKGVKKLILVVIATIAATTCAYAPIALEFSSEETALLGDAGGGKFNFSNLDGLTCSGEYSLLSKSPAIQTYISCNDGKTGRILVLRTGSALTNGSGVGN